MLALGQSFAFSCLFCHAQAGDVLVTGRRMPILTFMEDTGPGVHDTLVAACSHELYEIVLGIKPEVC